MITQKWLREHIRDDVQGMRLWRHWSAICTA